MLTTVNTSTQNTQMSHNQTCEQRP